jgi:hypothetical protein
MRQIGKIKLLFWVFIFCHFFSLGLFAQTVAPYQNREFNLYLTNFLIHDSAANFLLDQSILNYKSFESSDSIIYPRKQKKNYFLRKLRRASFIRVHAKDFFLTLDPIINFSAGTDLEDSLSEKLVNNSRGVLVRGNIGKQFAFESSFIENQATFPNYLDAFVDTYKVVPGQGRWKKFKSNGYDFAASQGTFSYQPFHFFTVQAGHGKHFVGKGYRSLLLSNNSFNYPYAHLKFHNKKISYSIIYASLQVVDKVRNYTSNLNEPLFKKKSATFHYLTVSPLKSLTIRLFQATSFQVRDSAHPYFNWNSLNPIIFSSSLQYDLNRSPNVLLGADINFTPTKNSLIYGQYMLDDFSSKRNNFRNKTGFQIGATYFNLLGIKNLIVQTEYNQVRPYSYAHSIPSQSYSHYGQALAHPLGANFREVIGFINYRWKDFLLELKFNSITYGADSANKNFGKDVFASNNFSVNGNRSSNNTFLQGEKTKVMYAEFKLAYLLNPASNLNLFFNLVYRDQNTVLDEQKNLLVYFGIKTSLFNNYIDF